VKQVSRELGVKFVLEGSVRKAGNKVRITAQLIDAPTGSHVWAERYDRGLEDIFAVQDEITTNIIGAIAPGMVSAEVQRSLDKRTANLGSWDRVMRAHWHIRRFTQDDLSEAIDLLEQLLDYEPNNATALADLAFALHFGVFFGWIDNPPEAMARVGETARRAVAADDQDSAAHTALAIHDLFSGRHDEAIRRLETATALNPNSSYARGYIGTTHAFAGEGDEAIDNLQAAMRLSPRDPLTVVWHTASAWAYLNAGKFDQAVASARQAIDWNPEFMDAHGTLAAASAHLGNGDDAQAALAEFVRRMPGLSVKDPRLWRPFRRPADLERFLAGLRAAGLPEA
jgi:tetratricopeptide (TPR) repeat protein